jgi:hypothetical protein
LSQKFHVDGRQCGCVQFVPKKSDGAFFKNGAFVSKVSCTDSYVTF